MSTPITRRQMLQSSALAGAGLFLMPAGWSAAAVSANEKLNIAIIGIGGRGGANVNGVSSQNLVALCDVDDERAGDAYKRFPKARKFYDYRIMLEEMESQIDAVVISTPDHTHAHPAMMAMRMGKHCYCEKPMAHSIAETRAMTKLAREKGLATQLGVQRHALSNVHRVVEIIQSGMLGAVEECYAWIGGDRGMPEIPVDFPDVPASLKWDLWIGPAAFRPYSPAYCPYNWRFWWDFGTGETGNWGCHILDIPFWALGLEHPERVWASGPAVHPQTTPRSMKTGFRFPAVPGKRGDVVLHWSQTKEGPEVLKEHGLPNWGSGVLFIGREGMLLCNFDKFQLFPETRFSDSDLPEPSIEDSPGFYKEWLAACKGGPKATCHFDYSGPLTETVLLGNAAYRAGAEFDWDAKTMTASGGNAALEALIRPVFREGWPL